MKKPKTIMLIVGFLVITSYCMVISDAQEVGEQDLLDSSVVVSPDPEIASSEDVQMAGTTPDSPLWQVEMVADRVGELFSENAKIIHIQERIAEMKVMVAKNMTHQAEKAQVKLEKTYARLKEKALVKEQKAFADNLGQKIRQFTSQTAGSMNETLRYEVKQLIQEHKTVIQIEIDKLKNQTRTQD